VPGVRADPDQLTGLRAQRPGPDDHIAARVTSQLPVDIRVTPSVINQGDLKLQLAVAGSRTGRIGLLATPATVASGAYERAVRAADRHVHVEPVACPDLAPIIQGGFPFDEQVVRTVRGYCAPLREADVDTVILGCTHYPLVAPMLQRMLGRGVTLVTSGAGVARSVERALTSRGLLNPREGEGSYGFRCTGEVGAFSALATRFLQMPVGEVQHVDLSMQAAAA